MIAYIARRILLMIPTLFGIMLISFVIVQFAPGGPVEKILAQLQGNDTSATSRISGGARSASMPRGSTRCTLTRSTPTWTAAARQPRTTPTRHTRTWPVRRASSWRCRHVAVTV